MNKADLIELVAQDANITRVKAEVVVNTVFDSMAEALTRNERVEVRDFGTFVTRGYEAYKGRNPRSGEEIEVGAKRMPHFKVGRQLKESIRG